MIFGVHRAAVPRASEIVQPKIVNVNMAFGYERQTAYLQKHQTLVCLLLTR